MVERDPRVPAKVARAIAAINAVDDRLGRYADYEGNQDGPTFSLWMAGPAVFAAQVERAIKDHEAAIKAWHVLGLLNHKHQDRATVIRRADGTGKGA